jgi:hypothetical protein
VRVEGRGGRISHLIQNMIVSLTCTMYFTASFFPATLGGGVVMRRSFSHLLRIHVVMRRDQESWTRMTGREEWGEERWGVKTGEEVRGRKGREEGGVSEERGREEQG